MISCAAGAVEAVLRLLEEPRAAGAVVEAAVGLATLQRHGAVLPAPAGLAVTEVVSAPVLALATHAGLVSTTKIIKYISTVTKMKFN